jgi:ribosomal-protein-alanine N-acetyltransferase
VHKKAEITYVVGDRKYWGKGVGSFAVLEITKKAINIYKLNKLFAGVVDANVGSRRVLEKNGFVLEGTRIKHLFYDGKFYNQLDYGLLLSI